MDAALRNADYLVQTAGTRAQRNLSAEQLRTDVWLLSVEVRYLRRLLGAKATAGEWRLTS